MATKRPAAAMATNWRDILDEKDQQILALREDLKQALSTLPPALQAVPSAILVANIAPLLKNCAEPSASPAELNFSGAEVRGRDGFMTLLDRAIAGVENGLNTGALEKHSKVAPALRLVRAEMMDANEPNFLEEEDMHIFDEAPLSDKLSLVVCNNCQKPVKESQYPAHLERCQALAAAAAATAAASAEGEQPEAAGAGATMKPPRKGRRKKDLPPGPGQLKGGHTLKGGEAGAGSGAAATPPAAAAVVDDSSAPSAASAAAAAAAAAAAKNKSRKRPLSLLERAPAGAGPGAGAAGAASKAARTKKLGTPSATSDPHIAGAGQPLPPPPHCRPLSGIETGLASPVGAALLEGEPLGSTSPPAGTHTSGGGPASDPSAIRKRAKLYVRKYHPDESKRAVVGRRQPYLVLLHEFQSEGGSVPTPRDDGGGSQRSKERDTLAGSDAPHLSYGRHMSAPVPLAVKRYCLRHRYHLRGVVGAMYREASLLAQGLPLPPLVPDTERAKPRVKKLDSLSPTPSRAAGAVVDLTSPVGGQQAAAYVSLKLASSTSPARPKKAKSQKEMKRELAEQRLLAEQRQQQHQQQAMATGSLSLQMPPVTTARLDALALGGLGPMPGSHPSGALMSPARQQQHHPGAAPPPHLLHLSRQELAASQLAASLASGQPRVSAAALPAVHPALQQQQASDAGAAVWAANPLPLGHAGPSPGSVVPGGARAALRAAGHLEGALGDSAAGVLLGRASMGAGPPPGPPGGVLTAAAGAGASMLPLSRGAPAMLHHSSSLPPQQQPQLQPHPQAPYGSQYGLQPLPAQQPMGLGGVTQAPQQQQQQMHSHMGMAPPGLHGPLSDRAQPVQSSPMGGPPSAVPAPGTTGRPPMLAPLVQPPPQPPLPISSPLGSAMFAGDFDDLP
eukprot:jgi/Mesen1/11041/ME000098S10428